MKNQELRDKYDNMIESADIKILELSAQVNNNSTDQILKSVARETNEKMSKVLQDKDTELNFLREKLKGKRNEFHANESSYLE